jgi:hypothetical protein
MAAAAAAIMAKMAWHRMAEWRHGVALKWRRHQRSEKAGENGE